MEETALLGAHLMRHPLSVLKASAESAPAQAEPAAAPRLMSRRLPHAEEGQVI